MGPFYLYFEKIIKLAWVHNKNEYELKLNMNIKKLTKI